MKIIKSIKDEAFCSLDKLTTITKGLFMKKITSLHASSRLASGGYSSVLKTFVTKPIWGAAVILMVGSSACFGAPEALVEFTFDNNSNTGSLGGIGTLVTNSDKIPVLAASAGVGGGGALNLTSNTMGSAGGYFKMDDNNALDGMQSFTVAFWMKKTAAFGALSARMVSKRGDFWLDGWEICSSDDKVPDRLVGFIGEHSGYGVLYRDHVGYGTINQWIFVAMTFDGSTHQVAFYEGTETTPVSLVSPGVGDGDIAKNPYAEATAALTMGSGLYGLSAFQGYLDNIRIWGSKTESSAVLTLAELETYRLNDTKSVDK